MRIKIMIIPVVERIVKDDQMQIVFTYPTQKTSEEPFSCPQFADVIGTYAEDLAKAIENRMKKCLDNFTKNMANIFYTDPYFVGYKEEDGHIWKFGFETYDLMGRILDALHYNQWNQLKNAQVCDQLVKALLEYDGEIKDYDTIKICDLHAALMEVVACDPRHIPDISANV